MESTFTSPLYTAGNAANMTDVAVESGKSTSLLAGVAKGFAEVGIFAALYIAGVSICYLAFL